MDVGGTSLELKVTGACPISWQLQNDQEGRIGTDEARYSLSKICFNPSGAHFKKGDVIRRVERGEIIISN